MQKSVNEKIPENAEDVNVEDTEQTPKISHIEGPKAVETSLRYFEQGASVMDLLFLRRLRDETAKHAACRVLHVQQRQSAECPAVYITTLVGLNHTIPTYLDGLDRCTREFKYPHSQKSAGVRSGDQGDQGDHGNLKRLLMIIFPQTSVS
ncbi:hypothetical protein TNCV_3208461 [Trichonephila clavipes]|nr:hypothetical protein TNCV_3208461 [Trichonephila clavipes]